MKSNNTHRFLGICVQILPHVMEEGGPRIFFWTWRKLAKVFFLLRMAVSRRKNLDQHPYILFDVSEATYDDTPK